jgi:hypothetical protein
MFASRIQSTSSGQRRLGRRWNPCTGHPPSTPCTNLPTPTYDNNRNDEHVDEVYDRDYGVKRGGGRRRGARVGARYKGLRRGGAGHRDAYGEQPWHQEYGREEPREYRMKIDLPSFDSHLHIEDFLD